MTKRLCTSCRPAALLILKHMFCHNQALFLLLGLAIAPPIGVLVAASPSYPGPRGPVATAANQTCDELAEQYQRAKRENKEALRAAGYFDLRETSASGGRGKRRSRSGSRAGTLIANHERDFQEPSSGSGDNSDSWRKLEQATEAALGQLEQSQSEWAGDNAGLNAIQEVANLAERFHKQVLDKANPTEQLTFLADEEKSAAPVPPGRVQRFVTDEVLADLRKLERTVEKELEIMARKNQLQNKPQLHHPRNVLVKLKTAIDTRHTYEAACRCQLPACKGKRPCPHCPHGGGNEQHRHVSDTQKRWRERISTLEAPLRELLQQYRTARGHLRAGKRMLAIWTSGRRDVVEAAQREKRRGGGSQADEEEDQDANIESFMQEVLEPDENNKPPPRSLALIYRARRIHGVTDKKWDPDGFEHRVEKILFPLERDSRLQQNKETRKRALSKLDKMEKLFETELDTWVLAMARVEQQQQAEQQQKRFEKLLTDFLFTFQHRNAAFGHLPLVVDTDKGPERYLLLALRAPGDASKVALFLQVLGIVGGSKGLASAGATVRERQQLPFVAVQLGGERTTDRLMEKVNEEKSLPLFALQAVFLDRSFRLFPKESKRKFAMEVLPTIATDPSGKLEPAKIGLAMKVTVSDKDFRKKAQKFFSLPSEHHGEHAFVRPYLTLIWERAARMAMPVTSYHSAVLDSKSKTTDRYALLGDSVLQPFVRDLRPVVDPASEESRPTARFNGAEVAAEFCTHLRTTEGPWKEWGGEERGWPKRPTTHQAAVQSTPGGVYENASFSATWGLAWVPSALSTPLANAITNEERGSRTTWLKQKRAWVEPADWDKGKLHAVLDDGRGPDRPRTPSPPAQSRSISTNNAAKKPSELQTRKKSRTPSPGGRRRTQREDKGPFYRYGPMSTPESAPALEVAEDERAWALTPETMREQWLRVPGGSRVPVLDEYLLDNLMPRGLFSREAVEVLRGVPVPRPNIVLHGALLANGDVGNGIRNMLVREKYKKILARMKDLKSTRTVPASLLQKELIELVGDEDGAGLLKAASAFDGTFFDESGKKAVEKLIARVEREVLPTASEEQLDSRKIVAKLVKQQVVQKGVRKNKGDTGARTTAKPQRGANSRKAQEEDRRLRVEAALLSAAAPGSTSDPLTRRNKNGTSRGQVLDITSATDGGAGGTAVILQQYTANFLQDAGAAMVNEFAINCVVVVAPDVEVVSDLQVAPETGTVTDA